MRSRNPVIVGYDAVSPLGTELQDQWQRAINGESGIGPLTRFEVTPSFPVRIAGQVPEFDGQAYPFLQPRQLALWPSPVFKYALLVVHRALMGCGLKITPQLAPRVAVTFSSAVGGQDAVLNADRRMIAENKLPPPYTNPNSCINMVGGKVSMLTGATGPISACITACATGMTSITIGAMLLAQNRADLVICGAVDFALVEPIVAGFATMNGAFQQHPEQGAEPIVDASRPFSLNRKGFVISEGAGCILLADREIADDLGLPYDIELAGWAMTSDAHHYVAPHLPTVTRCIAEALENASVDPADIDAVNAHAASTKVGDRVEYDALREVFGQRIPPVTANKSMIGHAMGASSAIESIFAMEGMRTDTLTPTIHYTPDPDMPIDCVAQGARHREQTFVLKNAFGFGGCNACIVFKRI